MGNKYVVKKGDNLWEIARRFNTSVKNLRVANNLRSNRLDIGDVLIIPRSEKGAVKKVGSIKQYNKWRVRELNNKIEDKRVVDE